MMGLSKSTLSLSVLGWLVSILGVNAVLRGYEAPLQTATDEEVLQYVFDHDGAARFRVGELVSQVELSLHLESPMDRELSQTVEMHPDTYLYGINALFEADGAPPLEQIFWIRSKVSDNTEGSPLWVSDRLDTVVTNTRTITFDLDETIPNGGTITISPMIQEEQRVLFRIEKRLEITPETQPRPGSTARRASQWLPFGAGSVSSSELEQMSTGSLRPLGAEWLNGNTTELYKTGLLQSRQVAAGEHITLLPSQGTSLTLRGPCTIQVASSPVSEALGESQVGAIEPEVTIIRRGIGEGVITNEAIEVPADGLWRIDWLLPAEAEPHNISFSTDDAGACVWGEPDAHAGASEAAQILLPETRRLTSYRLTEESDDLVVSVASGSRHGVLNVEARSSSRSTVTYEITDSNGAVISTGRFVSTGAIDPFATQVEPSLGRVHSATKFRLVHPYAAANISFSSDAQVDLRFLAQLQVEPLQAPMYELPRGWRSANSPWDMAPYISLVPQGLEQLLQDQRLVRFDAVVHPVRRESSRPEGLCESHTIAPERPSQSYSIYEEARGQTDEWRQWDRSRVAGRIRLNIPSDGKLSVDYRFYDEPPTSVALTCGDVSDTEEVTASAGVFRFDGFETGWQNCQLEDEGSFSESALLLARAEGSSRRWAQRRVYRISDQDTYRIEVDVPRGGTTLYARLYQPAGGTSRRPVVHVEVDDGRPTIQTGLAEHPTTASRDVSIVASGRRALLSDAADHGLTPLQGIAVTLGDDLSAGTHTVSLSLNRRDDVQDSGGYVRFDSCAGTPTERETNSRYWWREVSQ